MWRHSTVLSIACQPHTSVNQYSNIYGSEAYHHLTGGSTKSIGICCIVARVQRALNRAKQNHKSQHTQCAVYQPHNKGASDDVTFSPVGRPTIRIRLVHGCMPKCINHSRFCVPNPNYYSLNYLFSSSPILVLLLFGFLKRTKKKRIIMDNQNRFFETRIQFSFMHNMH